MRGAICAADQRRRARRVLDEAARRNTTVALTRRGLPEAVLVSYQMYQRLQAARTGDLLVQ